MHTLAILTIVAVVAWNTARAQQPPAAQGQVPRQPLAPGRVAPPPQPTPPQPGPGLAPRPEPTSTPTPASGPQLELLNEAPELPAEVLQRALTLQPPPATRPFGLRLQYDGVLPQLRRADNPLQLFNPFAPARYGSGLEHLAINPISGRAEGICLFAIRF